MKSFKMKFLFWKESIRKWAIKKLGGYTEAEIQLQLPAAQKDGREVVQLTTEFKIDYQEFKQRKKVMDYSDFKSYVESIMFQSMYETMCKRNLLSVYRCDKPEELAIVYRMKLDVLQP